MLKNSLYLGMSESNIVNKKTIENLRNGDMMAFDVIYRKYSPKLFGFILKILKVESDAEEIMQEVFMKIWEMRDKIETYTSFDSFLYTITYNKSINLIRKKITERKYVDFLKSQPELAEPAVIEDLHFLELSSKVDRLVQELPARQKEVFLLSREKELTYKEIAEELNISKNTVENHMVKALKYLRDNLKDLSLINSLFICLFLQ
jgi:RNA polymerase sigma-70 factor (ECF subfamily)